MRRIVLPLCFAFTCLMVFLLVPAFASASLANDATKPPSAGIDRPATSPRRVPATVAAVQSLLPYTIGSSATPNMAPILYNYDLVFDLSEGELRFSGSHSEFPSHELYVSDTLRQMGDDSSLESFDPYRDTRWGRLANPGILFSRASERVAPDSRRIPVDNTSTCGCQP